MKLYKDNGIYKITNNKNGKVYIGYATVSFGDRRDSHFACLRNGYHFNKELQNDFIKYGEESFIFDVIEIINSDDVEIYKEREQYYIKEYNAVESGYNLCNGGDTRVRPTDKKIRDMAKINREANIGKTASNSTKENMKAARRRNASRNHGENGSTILTEDEVAKIKKRLMNGDSVNEIARQYNVSFACISQINVGKNWKSVIVDGWDEYVSSKNY